MPLTISDPNVTTFCDSKSTCSGHTAHASASVARVSAIKAGEAILVMTVRCFSFVFSRICQSMFLRDPFSHEIFVMHYSQMSRVSPIESTGHGESNNGTCVCDSEGWLGPTCSDGVFLWILDISHGSFPKARFLRHTVFTAYFGCTNLKAGPITLPVGVCTTSSSPSPSPLTEISPRRSSAGSFHNSISMDISRWAIPATPLLTWTLGGGRCQCLHDLSAL